MHATRQTGKAALPLLLLLLGVIILAGGCSGPICNKHLFIFRETPEKSLPEVTALLITDPNLAAALVPEASGRVNQGLPWAPEQLVHQTDAYRLSLTGVDGRTVYQGDCYDRLITDVCEVRQGSRHLSLKVELYGPWGQRNQREELRVDLKGGTVYFLAIEGMGGPEKPVRVALVRLETYTPEFRHRLVEWQRQHTKGRTRD